MISFRATRLIALLAFLTVPQALFAQYGRGWQPPRGVNLEQLRDTKVDGTVEGVQGNMLQVKDATDHPYLIALQPEFSKLAVTGMAKADYLKPGLMVSFTADLPKDKKVELEATPADLAIITPSETNTLGIFNEDRDNKDSTKFFVRGKVTSFKDGKLTLAAGPKQIIAPLPPDAEIKVEGTDLNHVRQGDSIKVVGKEYKPFRSEGNNVQPGQVIGQTVDIRLQETLSGATPKKKPAGKTSFGDAKQ